MSFSIYTWPKEIKLRHQNMNWNSLQIEDIVMLKKTPDFLIILT